MILVFVLGLWGVRRNSSVSTDYHLNWIAARQLPAYHQMQPGDLLYPHEWLAAGRLLLRDESFRGKHLRSKGYNPGNSIYYDEISQRPELKSHLPNSQIYFYVLKEDTTPTEGWTEGTAVIPCYKKTAKSQPASEHTVCIHTPLSILAIHTATAPNEVSWLAIEVPEKLRCTFAEFALAERRLLFQIDPSRVGLESSPPSQKLPSGPKAPL
jgi:hypothetical protein